MTQQSCGQKTLDYKGLMLYIITHMIIKNVYSIARDSEERLILYIGIKCIKQCSMMMKRRVKITNCELHLRVQGTALNIMKMIFCNIFWFGAKIICENWYHMNKTKVHKYKMVSITLDDYYYFKSHIFDGTRLLKLHTYH